MVMQRGLGLRHKAVAYLVVVLLIVASGVVVGNTRIREVGSDTWIEDTDGGTVFFWSDGTLINATGLNVSSNYAYDGEIHNSNGNSWTANWANIQVAVDDLAGNGTVWLPAGTYQVTSALEIDYNCTSIVGIGPDGTWGDVGSKGSVVFDLAYDGNFINVDGGSYSGRILNPHIENIKFYNPSYTQLGNGIYFNYVVGGEIIDCSFNRVNNSAIVLDMGCYSTRIRNCLFQHCGNVSDANGTIHINGDINLDKVTDTNIYDCVFEVDKYRSIYSTNIATTAKIHNNYFEAESGKPPVHISGDWYRSAFMENTFFDASGTSTAIQVLQDVRIAGNHFNTYQIGVISVSDCIIEGNYFYDTTQYGLRHGGNHAVITGNLFFSCGADTYAGIRLQGSASYNTITGNIINQCGTDGLSLIPGCDNNTVMGNVIADDGSGHTDYGIDLDGDNNTVVGNNCNDTIVQAIANSGSNNVVNLNNVNISGGAADGYRTQEEIEDFVGAMVSGNTESNISVVYQDGDGTLDFDAENDYLLNGKVWTDVDSYPATGTGIQAANDNLTAGGTIYLPNATITITTQITLDDDITLAGAGVGATILYSNSGILPVWIGGKENVTLRDFSFDMNNAGSNCINISQSKNIWLSRISLINVGHQGFYIVDGENIFVSDIHILMGASTAAHGFGVLRTQNSVFSDIILENYHHDAAEDGIDFAGCRNITATNLIIRGAGWHDGIKITGDPYTSDNIMISNLEIYDVTSNGMKIQESTNIVVNGFHIKGAGGNGISFETTDDKVALSNGHISTVGNVGLYILGFNVTCSNIEINDTTSIGLSVSGKNIQLSNVRVLDAGSFNKIASGSSNIIITNCVFSYGASYGLSIDNTAHLKITDSIFEGNAAEGIDTTISACNNYSFIGNTFIDNDGGGVGVDCHASDDWNIITLNHFIGNTLDDHSATKGIISNNIGDDI